MAITTGARSSSCSEMNRPLQSQPHRFLKAGIHEREHRLVHILNGGRLRLAFDPEWQRGIVNHWSRAKRDRNCPDTRNGVHFLVEVAETGARFRGVGC